MSEHTQLEQAISHLESQRAVLGEAATEAAVAALKQKLSALDKTESGGERKLVTVMFADISGFTALSENMDPEAVRDLMNRCFDRLVPCIKNYDGTIDKFIGDEIMALFGAPVAHENDPERALRAALEIQSALIRFNTENKTQLGIHFGINTGLVLAGGIGSSGQQEYSVMGDAVNMAARLEDVSERGQILAGPDTYRLTAPLFDFETLSPVTIKGKSEPVAVYRLIGAKAGAVSARGLERKGLSSPLVGREKEFQILEKLIENVRSGQGGVVGIIGEAGLGKSRLMVELRKSAPGVQWLEGKTLSFGQSISYFPFQEIVRTYAGISEEDAELEAWNKLERKTVALFPDTALEILPYLATLLAVEVQGEYIERVKYLDGDALGKRVFLAMRRFVERLARTQPLVLVFEDLHWMDTSSVELLEHILPLVREAPLLIIGISRPDPDTAGARLQKVCAEKYADIYSEIRLAPLSSAESTQLVNNLLAIDDLPARVRERMTQKAEGNPFFIEEIIRSLLDMGAIVRDPSSGRWRATAQIETVHIPDTVQGVIMARIDRLDEDVKQALRIAAVIGRSFLYRILRELDAADDSLDIHLSQLQQVELIREKQAMPELEYIFKHALAQEATYESILLQKRRELHGRVAESIEALFADRLDEFYSLLAYHYAKAENWAKAQEYLFKSGEQAGKMAADAEALAHYRQAMEAYVKAFGDQWDPLQRAQLEQKMGEAFNRRGDYQQAKEYLHRALGYLGQPYPETTLQLRWAIVKEIVRQVGFRTVPKLFLLGSPKGADTIDTEFQITIRLGWMDIFSSVEFSLYDGLKVLNRSEQCRAWGNAAHGMAGMGYAFIGLNLHGLAEIYLQQAKILLQLAPSAQRARGVTNGSISWLRFNQGRLTEAMKHACSGSQIYHEIGDMVEFLGMESFKAEPLFYQGDFKAAFDVGNSGLHLAREMQDIHTEGYFLIIVAKTNSVLGEWEHVVEQLQRSIELAKKTPSYIHYVSALGHLAWHYIRSGKLEQALACLEEAQVGIKKHGTLGWYNMQTFKTYAEACLLKAEQSDDKKSHWLHQAYQWLAKGLKQGQFSRSDLTEAQRFRGRYEWLKGNPSAARKWWERSLGEAETMGLRYFAALTHLEMGQRLRDMEHLQKAEAVFAEVGALPDLEKARAIKSATAER